MTDVTPETASYLAPAEVEDVELYHPKSFVTKYIWSQDAKVIAIQYAVTAIAIGLVALVLSWMMRLQLGFPDTFSFISPEAYLQLITMHGCGNGSIQSACRRIPCALRRIF
jgi:cytochrome c oxidase subunit I